MITGGHWVCFVVVSAMTQPTIEMVDLAMEATNAVRDIRQGAHMLECLFIISSTHLDVLTS